MRLPVALVVLLGASLQLATAAAPAAGCEKLGFTADLKCSTCETMGDFVKDQELLADCTKCCTKDAAESSKYTSATLEVCDWRLSALQAVKDFIDKKASLFKPRGLVVKYVQGAPPRIVLRGKQGSETIRIDAWKLDTIVEFLEDKLAPAGAAKAEKAAAGKAADAKASGKAAGDAKEEAKEKTKKKKKADKTASS